MALNENLEAIMSKVSDVAQSAARKAKDAATIAKHKVSIMTEEDKIKKAQTELGKLYYRDFSEGSDPAVEEYLPWCDKITAAKAAIEELKAAIEALKADDDEAEVEEETTPEFEEAAPEAADIQIEVVDDAPKASDASEEN